MTRITRCIPFLLRILAALFVTVYSAQPALAQNTEQRFQDVFVTAGYATAFGAALGAASLSFFDNPQDHLQYVAVGASLGFIGGSILGTYIVLAPLAANEAPGATELAAYSAPLTIKPVFSSANANLMQLESIWTIASF